MIIEAIYDVTVTYIAKILLKETKLYLGASINLILLNRL